MLWVMIWKGNGKREKKEREKGRESYCMRILTLKDFSNIISFPVILRRLFEYIYKTVSFQQWRVTKDEIFTMREMYGSNFPTLCVWSDGVMVEVKHTEDPWG